MEEIVHNVFEATISRRESKIAGEFQRFEGTFQMFSSIKNPVKCCDYRLCSILRTVLGQNDRFPTIFYFFCEIMGVLL